MKYKIEREEQKTEFKPFSITLTFETKKEYVNFHDNVMGKITQSISHPFHKDLFCVGRGEQDGGEGKI